MAKPKKTTLEAIADKKTKLDERQKKLMAERRELEHKEITEKRKADLHAKAILGGWVIAGWKKIPVSEVKEEIKTIKASLGENRKDIEFLDAYFEPFIRELEKSLQVANPANPPVGEAKARP